MTWKVSESVPVVVVAPISWELMVTPVIPVGELLAATVMEEMPEVVPWLKARDVGVLN